MRRDPDNPISADTLAADALARWPCTAAVFLARRMGCVGCAMAGFETMAEVVDNYSLEPEAFVRELLHHIERAGRPQSHSGGAS